MKKYIVFVLIMLIIALDFSIAKAELLVKAKMQGAMYLFVNIDNFPVLEADIQLSVDGVITPVTAENIIIYENGLDGITPFEVNGLDNGYQHIKWYPENIKLFHDSLYISQLVVSMNGETGVFKQGFLGWIKDASYFHVTDADAGELREMNWGIVQPGIGNKIPQRVYVTPKHVSFANHDKIRVDSITTSKKQFYVNKTGAVLYAQWPEIPYDLIPNEGYWISVTFEPDSKEAIHDNLVIHYAGGLKDKIALYGNKTTYEKETILRLISPNGGETFTPCEEVEISWASHVQDVPVNIFYNYGIWAQESWVKIGEVTGESSFIWTVPPTITDRAKIKISQDLTENASRSINIAGGGVRDIAYNTIGDKALAITNSGIIQELDLYPTDSNIPKAIGTWKIGNDNFAVDSKPFGVDYITPDSMLALYTYNEPMTGIKKVYAAFLLNGQDVPDEIVELTEEDKGGKKLVVSPDKKYISIVNQGFQSTLNIYSTTDLSLYRRLVFDSPVIDFVFNDILPNALIATLDGEIHVISTTDYTISKTIDNQDELLPTKLGYSPNGKLLSFGFPNFYGKTDNFLYDIEKETVIKPIRASYSNPVSHTFSPDSKSFVLGSEFVSQIVMMDLTSGNEPEALTGHIGDALTGVEFAPDAHSLISSSAGGSNNFIFRTFTFPDYDDSDDYFNVVPVDIVTPVQNIEPVYMGTSHEINITDVCNVGNVPIIYDELRLAQGIHYKLRKTHPGNTEAATLLSGECSDYLLDYFPYSSGQITDTLIFTVCEVDYYVIITGEVYPRDIKFFTDEYDFGEVCLFKEERYTGVVFTNNDPAPLIINGVEIQGDDETSFWRSDVDTVLQANQSLEMWISFTPRELGEKNAKLIVKHSYQGGDVGTMDLKGTGIGTYVDISHKKLLFIPEIDTRELTIVNTGGTPIDFDNVSMNPEGYFEVLTELPQQLEAGGTIIFEIQQIASPDANVQLLIDAVPCLVQSEIYLGNYMGTAIVNIEDIEADPREETILPIYYKSIEGAGAYNGIRFFEGVLTVNSHLLLPMDIESPFYNAMITDDYVENGTRYSTFRIEGDFKGEGLLVNIKAIPGIAETDYSIINMANDAPLFGEAVNASVDDGSITIINTNGRKIYRLDETFSNLSIQPNPAEDYIEIVFESLIEDNCYIDIISSDGKVVSTTLCPSIKVGENRKTIILNSLAKGSYTVRIYSENAQIISTLIINR